MNKKLSGAARDVLHALFFRGALVDGDLPSKSGAAELRELGFVKAQHTMAAFRGENHYNFLTPSGQEFAITYLVDSRFGKKSQTVRELVIKPSIDVSDLQETIDQVLDSIRKSDVFEVLSGETFINNTLLKGVCHLTAASDQCLMKPLEQAALKRINKAVNDAIANALRPGGLLYARK